MPHDYLDRIVQWLVIENRVMAYSGRWVMVTFSNNAAVVRVGHLVSVQLRYASLDDKWPAHSFSCFAVLSGIHKMPSL